MDTTILMTEPEAHMAQLRGEQVRRGMLTRAKEGMPTGTVPLGYRIWGRRIKVVEPAATHIRNVFSWIDEDNLPVRTAWRRATAAGLVSRRGKPLSVSAFQLLVRNPFYAGYIKFDGRLYQGIHEPIVASDCFERVQRSIQS